MLEEITALNDKAKIEFQGVFSDMKKSELIKPNEPKPEDAKQSVQPEVTAQVKSPDVKNGLTSAKPNANSNAINKGLSGL